MTTEDRPDSIEYLRERVTQLEWEIEKLSGIKNVMGVSREELDELSQPTRNEEIEWRVQSSGEDGPNIWARIIPYIDARAVTDRLDFYIGPERWSDSYREIDGGFFCTLSIFTINGWIQKEDASDKSDIESIKGGVSGALKRAAVKWGIGRDLYNYEPEYADVSLERRNGYQWAMTKNKKNFYWKKKEPAPVIKKTQTTTTFTHKPEEPPPFMPDMTWGNKKVDKTYKK